MIILIFIKINDSDINNPICVTTTQDCSSEIPNATTATRTWDEDSDSYGMCTLINCDTTNNYVAQGNICVDQCEVDTFSPVCNSNPCIQDPLSIQCEDYCFNNPADVSCDGGGFGFP